MRVRSLAVFMITLLIAGCSAAQAPASSGAKPGPEAAPSTPASQSGPAREPLACSGAETPAKEAMYRLLVQLTRYAPLKYLVGDARENELQWIALDNRDWPPTGRWAFAGQPWSGLEIRTDAAGAFLVDLTYGQNGTNITFQVVCAEGYWHVSKTGNRQWWAPLPAGIPGQEGPLTVKLARQLADEAMIRTGPNLTMVATGQQLELGRIEAIKVASDWVKTAFPWPNYNNELRITVQDDTHAAAECTDKNGKSAGECLRFVREDGRWKIENHTIDGQWPQYKVGKDRRPLELRQEIFGLKLGMSRADVERIVGQPDRRETTQSGEIYRYMLREFDVRFDQGGTVSEVTIRAGATHSGIMVGAPISMVEVLYGPAPDYTYPFDRDKALQFSVQDGRIVSITLLRK